MSEKNKNNNYNNLRIDLNPATDRNGNIFYVGKLESPVTIDCKDGVTFLIYVANSGEEEMQIAPLIKEKKNRTDYQKTEVYKKISQDNSNQDLHRDYQSIFKDYPDNSKDDKTF